MFNWIILKCYNYDIDIFNVEEDLSDTYFLISKINFFFLYLYINCVLSINCINCVPPLNLSTIILKKT